MAQPEGRRWGTRWAGREDAERGEVYLESVASPQLRVLWICPSLSFWKLEAVEGPSAQDVQPPASFSPGGFGELAASPQSVLLSKDPEPLRATLFLQLENQCEDPQARASPALLLRSPTEGENLGGWGVRMVAVGRGRWRGSCAPLVCWRVCRRRSQGCRLMQTRPLTPG